MKIKFTVSLLHWMIGISFSVKYTTLVSIGPLNIWFFNEAKKQRDMENQIIRNMEEMSK